MLKLNQVVAATKTATANSEDEITKAYHALQKPDFFGGQIRTYAPREDGGEGRPDESQLVQTTVSEQVDRFVAGMVNVIDITATRNWGNTDAKADVTVDGEVLVKDAPVEFLLFLEKRLQYIDTLLQKVPVLDSAFKWDLNEADGLYHAQPVESISNKKTPRNHVKAEATDKHPAQVEVFMEDVPVGTWTTVRLSGAVPPTQVKQWRERTAKLMEAIKHAREEANSLEVQNKHVGEGLLNFVFGGN